MSSKSEKKEGSGRKGGGDATFGPTSEILSMLPIRVNHAVVPFVMGTSG